MRADPQNPAMSGIATPNDPSGHLLVSKHALNLWLQPMSMMVTEVNDSNRFRALELLAMPKLRADLMCEEVNSGHPLYSAVQRIDAMYPGEELLTRRLRLVEFSRLLLRDVMRDAVA